VLAIVKAIQFSVFFKAFTHFPAFFHYLNLFNLVTPIIPVTTIFTAFPGFESFHAFPRLFLVRVLSYFTVYFTPSPPCLCYARGGVNSLRPQEAEERARRGAAAKARLATHRHPSAISPTPRPIISAPAFLHPAGHGGETGLLRLGALACIQRRRHPIEIPPPVQIDPPGAIPGPFSTISTLCRLL
jgi:hypothetical protein